MINSLPASSPIFIYPFRDKISDSQSDEIISKSLKFLDQWKSHGSDLSTKVWIEENQFLIFVVDSSLSEPSGCSKDKLYHFVESLKDSNEISFGDLNKFWVKKDLNILSFTKKELKENIESESLSFENQLFPLWISDFEQYKKNWGAPLETFKQVLKLEEKKTIFLG
jgi:hypothetical protein